MPSARLFSGLVSKSVRTSTATGRKPVPVRRHLDRDLVATGDEVDLDDLLLPVGRGDDQLGRAGDVGPDDGGDGDEVAFSGRGRKDHALDQRVGAPGRRQLHHVDRHTLVGQSPHRRADITGGRDQVGDQDDSARAFARHQRRCRLQGTCQVGGRVVGDGPNRPRDPAAGEGRVEPGVASEHRHRGLGVGPGLPPAPSERTAS